MFQFYLLSILFNTLAGLILISYGSQKKGEIVPVQDVDLSLEAETEEAPKKSKKKGAIKESTIEAKKNIESKLSANEILSNEVFQLVVGILSFLTGFIKLFVVVKSGVKVFADFFPAVAGMYSGVSLILAYVLKKSSTDALPEVVQTIFLKYSFIIGISCLAVALLHFVFPAALFL